MIEEGRKSGQGLMDKIYGKVHHQDYFFFIENLIWRQLEEGGPKLSTAYGEFEKLPRGNYVIFLNYSYSSKTY